MFLKVLDNISHKSFLPSIHCLFLFTIYPFGDYVSQDMCFNDMSRSSKKIGSFRNDKEIGDCDSLKVNWYLALIEETGWYLSGVLYIRYSMHSKIVSHSQIESICTFPDWYKTAELYRFPAWMTNERFQKSSIVLATYNLLHHRFISGLII